MENEERLAGKVESEPPLQRCEERPGAVDIGGKRAVMARPCTGRRSRNDVAIALGRA